MTSCGIDDDKSHDTNRSGKSLEKCSKARQAELLAGGAIIKNKLLYFGFNEQNTVRGLGVTRISTVPTARVLSRNRS